MIQVIDRKHRIPVTYRDWEHFKNSHLESSKPKKKRFLTVRQKMGGHMIDLLYEVSSPNNWAKWRYMQGLDMEEVGLKDLPNSYHKEIRADHQTVATIVEKMDL